MTVDRVLQHAGGSTNRSAAMSNPSAAFLRARSSNWAGKTLLADVPRRRAGPARYERFDSQRGRCGRLRHTRGGGVGRAAPEPDGNAKKPALTCMIASTVVGLGLQPLPGGFRQGMAARAVGAIA
jgi:hypothetical protein